MVCVCVCGGGPELSLPPPPPPTPTPRNIQTSPEIESGREGWKNRFLFQFAKFLAAPSNLVVSFTVRHLTTTLPFTIDSHSAHCKSFWDFWVTFQSSCSLKLFSSEYRVSNRSHLCNKPPLGTFATNYPYFATRLRALSHERRFCVGSAILKILTWRDFFISQGWSARV
jgi:hypothetical protein